MCGPFQPPIFGNIIALNSVCLIEDEPRSPSLIFLHKTARKSPHKRDKVTSYSDQLCVEATSCVISFIHRWTHEEGHIWNETNAQCIGATKLCVCVRACVCAWVGGWVGGVWVEVVKILLGKHSSGAGEQAGLAAHLSFFWTSLYTKRPAWLLLLSWTWGGGGVKDSAYCLLSTP